jgi:hypothetical protein
MHLGAVQAVCFSADPNHGRFPPPKEKSHDVRLSHDVHCRDAWPLRRDGGQPGSDVLLPSYGARLLFFDITLTSVFISYCDSRFES